MPFSRQPPELTITVQQVILDTARSLDATPSGVNLLKALLASFPGVRHDSPGLVSPFTVLLWYDAPRNQSLVVRHVERVLMDLSVCHLIPGSAEVFFPFYHGGGLDMSFS